jgi:hypothetical protein
MVQKRRISSKHESSAGGDISSNADNTAMILSSKDVALAVSTSALLLEANHNTDQRDVSRHDDSSQHDERDELNEKHDPTPDETHFAIHWPLGHNMIVAFSRSRWSAHMNKAGRPVVDALAKEIVNDILSFQPGIPPVQ